MVAVRGSKQYQMVVVPHRPFYKGVVFTVFIAAVAAFSWLTYRYGFDEGIATRQDVVQEREQLRQQLQSSADLVREMRQEVASLKLGGEIDNQATEEVRQTVETLQNRIAELKEEVRFYKGVMIPNAGDKGLRIERLDLTRQGVDVNYRLLLTQVVEKHDYIQGSVSIELLGRQGENETKYRFQDIAAGESNSMRFRFRYFQNIEGMITVPGDFEPQRVTVTAQLSATGGVLEKQFDWGITGG